MLLGTKPLVDPFELIVCVISEPFLTVALTRNKEWKPDEVMEIWRVPPFINESRYVLQWHIWAFDWSVVSEYYASI